MGITHTIEYKIDIYIFKVHSFFFFCLPVFSRATPVAYEGSQARGPVGAVAPGLRQSHSNAESKPCLRTIPQLRAIPDP